MSAHKLKRTISKTSISFSPPLSSQKKKSSSEDTSSSAGTIFSYEDRDSTFQERPEVLGHCQTPLNSVCTQQYASVSEVVGDVPCYRGEYVFANLIQHDEDAVPDLQADGVDFTLPVASRVHESDFGLDGQQFEDTECFLPTPSPMLPQYAASTAGHYSTSTLGLFDVHATTSSFLRRSLDYFGELRTHYQYELTFSQLYALLEKIPGYFAYFRQIVCSKLAVPVHLVEVFFERFILFLSDPDIRDATTSDFLGFLYSLYNSQAKYKLPSVFKDVTGFFSGVLQEFKAYLLALWLSTKKISSACEFGQKSDTLFLCMECHSEHY